MIKLESVTYRYRDDLRPALFDVNLEIAEGESVCVMGANGSGKSTFAKLVAGLIKPQQGRLILNVSKKLPIPAGLLFQNPDNQIIAVTVEKEVAFALENLGVEQQEMAERIESILKKMSIGHLKNRLTSELSAGEKQRLALAALLVFEPPVMILDEPDSFLDSEGKKLLREQLRVLCRKNDQMTLIDLTQYDDIARQYRRLIVFDQGRVIADGNPQTILSDADFCINHGLAFDNIRHKQIALPSFDETRPDSSDHDLARIELNRISFAHPGGNLLLRHFSAEFESGQITVLVGPSGSGKSTLGMLLCGVLKPDSGEVRYFDSSANTLAGKHVKGKVTAALQQPERQFFLQTCEQEIRFGPKNLGLTIDKLKLKRLFEMVGLSTQQFEARDPFTLSLGEKRRLAFAAVLAMNPDFVVFDEPTCALDPEGVGRFALLAKALKSAGLGLVIITHDTGLVRELADKIIAFDGRGNPAELPIDTFQSGGVVSHRAASG